MRYVTGPSIVSNNLSIYKMADEDISSANADIGDRERTAGGVGGLIAILLAIILGGLLGVYYGKSMWMASGGPSRALLRLKETIDQKRELAERFERNAELAEAGEDEQEAEWNREEAARLRGHVPVIQKEVDRVEELEKEAHESSGTFASQLAFFVWEMTKFCGDLFLQVLKLLVIPLVVTSMICGITSLGDIRKLGRVGGWTISYYMLTCAAAVLIGIGLVIVIKPGAQVDDTFAYVTENVVAKKDTGVMETLLDVFRGREDDPGSGMFPSNIFQAASKTNVLALIIFAIFFGGALTTLGTKGKVAIDFFVAANEAVMKMVHIVILFAPIGILGLVAYNIARNGGGDAFGEELRRLGWYVATVLIGLASHVVLLGLLLPILAGRNPFAYTYNMLRALLTAMSTASSAATLPVTMECVEENNKVSNRSASFVLPLGATINMDGTALYEAVAVIFIAQTLGIDLDTGQLVIIFLTATLAAVGAAGIPEAGLVTMVIVLTAVGLPLEGIGTILAIDWFLDRMRTTVNVYGDSIGAAVVDRRVVSPSA